MSTSPLSYPQKGAVTHNNFVDNSLCHPQNMGVFFCFLPIHRKNPLIFRQITIFILCCIFFLWRTRHLSTVFWWITPQVIHYLSTVSFFFLGKNRKNPAMPPRKPPICPRLSTFGSKKPSKIAVAARKSMVE